MENSSGRLNSLIAIGLMGGFLTLNPTASWSGDTSAKDETVSAIRSVLQRQEADWNKGDLEAFLTGYWRSPKLVFQSGGSRHDGWDATRDRYFRRYKAEGKSMGRVAFSSVEIEPLGPDSAFVRGSWRLTLPDSSHAGGLFTLIFRKFADGWKIVHDHTSMEEKPAAKQ